MNYAKYTSNKRNILLSPKTWRDDDTRDVLTNSADVFRTLKRVMRGRTTEYQVLKLDGSIENAFRTVGDAMAWCLQRLDAERGG